MATPFLSSEEYDERAHQLYNEGQYDDALAVLREGLALYPNSVELHIGVGYARLAREEYAWARRSFEEALVLEPEHEDAPAAHRPPPPPCPSRPTRAPPSGVRRPPPAPGFFPPGPSSSSTSPCSRP